MVASSSDVQGSCNCGAVKLVVKGGFGEEKGELCHCNSCRKSGGSLAAYLCGAKVTSVSITEGNPKVFQETGDSGKAVYRRFCGDCGSPLWIEVDSMPGMAYIALALFSADQGVGLEIFYRNAHPWEKPYAPEGKVCQTQPG